jgi:ubiquinone/menaquinone biosynthesis C-methylase UbiE/uncharacterized protein YbaR (Trm112 family)
MFSTDVLGLLRCPNDLSPLEAGEGRLVCAQCKTEYPFHDGYVEILPREEFERTTLYGDDAGKRMLDYREIGPPLLSAKIKNDVMNDWMRFNQNDLVLDLGCGNGKFALWNRPRVKSILAIDLAPWFADAVRRELPLFRGDIRALPFDDATFDKVYTIDVLEHLSANDIHRVLVEVRRTLKPGGRLFVFSNTRERQTLWWAIAPQRALSRWLMTHRLIDTRRDDWRKSDHVKAIATFQELTATFSAHGFTITRVAFWNGIFQGWIENVLLKLGETWASRDESGRDPLEQQLAARHKVREALGSKHRARLYIPLAILTAIMSLDLKLFGRLRAGPYFVMVERNR